MNLEWAEKPQTAVVLQLVLIILLLAIFGWAMFRSHKTTKVNQQLISFVCRELFDHRIASEDAHDRLLIAHGRLTSLTDTDDDTHECLHILEGDSDGR